MKAEIMEIMMNIPYGRVTTYGHVAEILGMDYGIKTSGWMVGRVLGGMTPEEEIRYPWRRVINREGYLPTMKLGARGLRHKIRLEKEKIPLINDHVDMEEYGRRKTWK